jgi:hypothetical protein
MAAATTTITCNVVVQFGDASVSAFVEIDDRPEGFNHGKTSFAPGDIVYMLLFMPTGYEVKYFAPTAGLLQKTGDDMKVIEDTIQFINEDSNTPQYPVDDPVAIGANLPVVWLGNNLGNIAKKGEFLLSLPQRGTGADGKPIPLYRIGIGNVTYKAACQVWKLSGVPQLTLNPITSVICYWVLGKKE